MVLRCGTVPYEEARATQRRLEKERQAGSVPDLLLLLEHPPVYTRGRRSTPDELPMGNQWYEMQGIEIRDTDRGGRVTYHGPGQLVVYPIISLRAYGDDVHAYVRRLELVTIGALGEHGLSTQTIEGLTGVWTDGRDPRGGPRAGAARKVASIGIHLSRGVTTHGFAINVSNDLQPFEWIVPCGIDDCRVTSLSRELGSAANLDVVAATVAERFAEIFDRSPVETKLGELAQSPSRLKA